MLSPRSLRGTAVFLNEARAVWSHNCGEFGLFDIKTCIKHEIAFSTILLIFCPLSHHSALK